MPKRILQGLVVSDKCDKTVTVLVERKFKDPFYKKTVRSNKKYKAHDAENSCKIGDIIRIEECRPISKDKSWTVVENLGRGSAEKLDSELAGGAKDVILENSEGN